MEIDEEKLSCILEKLQTRLQEILKEQPYRKLEKLDIVLDADIPDNDTALNLKLSVSADGSRPVTPSYDEILARLIDKLRAKFEEILENGECNN
ncbi:MAG: hypothetical protein GSR76_03900 [Desulfurococcales archaeon]|nr:hypothetical protein [Desulfurococcales archaeon]